MTQIATQTTTRSKIVFFIWNNLPRFVLLAMMALIFVLMGSIKEKSGTLKAEKEAAVAEEKPPVNAITYSVTPTEIADRINLPGSIEPWTRLLLLSKLGGAVTEVAVKEGDRVKKGDVIARIEDADYRIAVDKAEAAYKLALADLKRDQSIFEKGVIPQATLEANSTRMQTARADYENARLMLSRTTVTSPMSGLIRRMDAKVGSQLSVGDPVAEILEIDRMKGVVGIPESDVTAVSRLDTVEIQIQALENRKISAKKHFLSPSPETVARLYNLELEIDNAAADILSGMFIRADIVKAVARDVLTVPFYSVISRNDEQFVFVEEEGEARKRVVSLGIMEKWMVQVTAGLQPGDRVLVEGHRDVENGQKINVIQNISREKDLTL
jgi:membrane fusion protein (multidrug efflux system)